MADFEDPWATPASAAATTPSKPTPASTSTDTPSAAPPSAPLTPGAGWADNSSPSSATGKAHLPSLTPSASTTDADPWADPWGGGGGGSTSVAPGLSSAGPSLEPSSTSPTSPKAVELPSPSKGWGDDVDVNSPLPAASTTLAMSGGIEVDDGGGWGGPIALPTPSAADIISRTASGMGEEDRPWGSAQAREQEGEEEEQEERTTNATAKDDEASPSKVSSPEKDKPTAEASAEPATSKLASVFSGWRLGRVGPRPQESSLSSAAAAANAATRKDKEQQQQQQADNDKVKAVSPASTFPALPSFMGAKAEAKPAVPPEPSAPGELPTEGPGWKQTKKPEPGLASKLTGFFSAGAAAASSNAGRPPVVSAAEDDEDEDENAAPSSSAPAPKPAAGGDVNLLDGPSLPQPPQGSAVARLFARWKRGGGGVEAGDAARGSFDVSKLGKDDLAWLERLQAEEMAKGGGPQTSGAQRQDDWLSEFEGPSTSGAKVGASLNRSSSTTSRGSTGNRQQQPAWARTGVNATASSGSLLDFDGFDPLGPPRPPQPAPQNRTPFPEPPRMPDPRYHYDEHEVEASAARRGGGGGNQPYSDRFDVALPPRSQQQQQQDGDDDEWSAFQDSPRLGGQARFTDEPSAQPMGRTASGSSNRPLPPPPSGVSNAYSPRASLDRSTGRASPALSAGSGGGSKRTSISLVGGAAQLHRASSPSPLGAVAPSRGPLLPPPPPPPSGRARINPPPGAASSSGRSTPTTTAAASPPMPTVPLSAPTAASKRLPATTTPLAPAPVAASSGASSNPRSSLSAGPGLTKDDLSFFESL